MKANLALLALFLVLTGCVNQPQTGANQIPIKLIVNFSDYSQSFNLNVSGNSTAFDALKGAMPIDYTDYGTGAFINGIGNTSNSDDHYWMFYVNGTLSDIGLSAYLINESVVIEMRYEKPVW